MTARVAPEVFVMAASKVGIRDGLRDGLIVLAGVASVAAAVATASVHPKAIDGLWSVLTGPQANTGCDRAHPRRPASDLDGHCRPALPPR